MQHIVNGKMVQVLAEPNGSVRSDRLRRAAKIPDDRPLILQTPDGSNKIINPGEILTLTPDMFFVDAPAHERGCGGKHAGQDGPNAPRQEP